MPDEPMVTRARAGSSTAGSLADEEADEVTADIAGEFVDDEPDASTQPLAGRRTGWGATERWQLGQNERTVRGVDDGFDEGLDDGFGDRVKDGPDDGSDDADLARDANVPMAVPVPAVAGATPSDPLVDVAAARAAAAPVPLAVPARHDQPPGIRHGREDDDRRPGFLTRMVAIALAVLIGVAGGVVALTWLFGRTVDALNPFDTRTIDRSGKPVLQSLNDLKTYHAASGYYEIVIDQETEVANLPSFLAGERVIFVAAGTVDATVDFSALGSGSVKTNEDRTAVTIALPDVQLGPAKLDLERSYVADHQRGLRERLQDAVGKTGGGQNTENLYRLAEGRLSAAGARTDDLRTRAQANTRAMLTSLMNQVGFTSVTVTFADPPG